MLVPRTLQNSLSLLNPEFATDDPDGSPFETWKREILNWRRKGSQRRYQGNGRRSCPHNTGHSSAPQGNSAGARPAPNVAAPPAPAAPAAPAMRYDPTYSANSNPNIRQAGILWVQPATDP